MTEVLKESKARFLNHDGIVKSIGDEVNNIASDTNNIDGDTKRVKSEVLNYDKIVYRCSMRADYYLRRSLFDLSNAATFLLIPIGKAG